MRIIGFGLIITLVGCMLVNEADAAYTGPPLKLPFQPGGKVIVNTQPGGLVTPRLKGGIDSGHINNGYHSIDFNKRYDNERIIAAADGHATVHPLYGGYGNLVMIDHEGGYVTYYAHLKTFLITDGDVKQGQELGIMGTTGDSTGVHLHFEIRHDNNGTETNPALQGISFEGIDFVDYKIDTWHASTNGFSFSPDSGNPHTCSDQPTGSAATGWVYSCTKQTSFHVGDAMWGNSWITDVTKDFCISAQLYNVASKTVEVTETEWCSTGVEPWGWARSHNMPWFAPRNEGVYEIHYLARLQMNSDYPPVPLSVAKFTMLKPQPYSYDGNGMTCADQPTGSAATGWVYSCSRPATTFSLGLSPTVYGLVGITNVKDDFKFITKVYKDGALQWTDEPFDYQVVDKPFGWGRSYAAPQGKPWIIGNWRFDVYMQVKGLSPVLLKSLPFTVVP